MTESKKPKTKKVRFYNGQKILVEGVGFTVQEVGLRHLKLRLNHPDVKDLRQVMFEVRSK